MCDSFFARISRVIKTDSQASCLHECQWRCLYDEQREREMRSISSLIIHIEIKEKVRIKT